MANLPPPIPEHFSARVARPSDALAIALLEGPLALRRRAAGDSRFDSPHAIDATLVGAIAAHLGRPQRDPLDATELVAVDEKGNVRGCASFGSSSLDPPFVPTKRAVLARFALDPAVTPAAARSSMIAMACDLAREAGAAGVELVDLTGPWNAAFRRVCSSSARGLGHESCCALLELNAAKTPPNRAQIANRNERGAPSVSEVSSRSKIVEEAEFR